MFLFLFLFGLALDGVVAEELQRGDCSYSWYSFNGRCYKYYVTRLNWADAEIFCLSENANLVSIHSLEEERFVQSLIMNFDPYQGRTWIGFSDVHKEGRWMWSDGSKADFTYWYSGQPDNVLGENCAHDFYTSQRWNDVWCSDNYAFVCKSRA